MSGPCIRLLKIDVPASNCTTTSSLAFFAASKTTAQAFGSKTDARPPDTQDQFQAYDKRNAIDIRERVLGLSGSPHRMGDWRSFSACRNPEPLDFAVRLLCAQTNCRNEPAAERNRLTRTAD